MGQVHGHVALPTACLGMLCPEAYLGSDWRCFMAYVRQFTNDGKPRWRVRSVSTGVPRPLVFSPWGLRSVESRARCGRFALSCASIEATSVSPNRRGEDGGPPASIGVAPMCNPTVLR